MDQTCILGIQIRERGNNISQVQHILTKYGCSIRTRLGLHDTGPGEEREKNLILLEMTGPYEDVLKMENELNGIQGLQMRKMVF